MRVASVAVRLGARWGSVLVLSAFALGCAGAAGGKGASSDEPSVPEQFEREAEPIQKQVVKGEGAFTAYIEAKAPPKVERKDQAWSITADLGWGGSEVECFVYDEVVDTGTAAHIMLKAAAKDVNFKSLQPYFLDHLALDPIIGIRGVYHAKREGTVLAGDFKLAVMSRMERPVICWHDAPGYAKSFARVTTEFAKSFQYESDQPKPTRAELWAMTLDGMPIGFSRDAYYALDDGTIRKVTLSASFVPAAPGEMSFDDDAEIITSDKKGQLTAGRYLSIENGESSMTIDVEKTKAGYNYVGTIQNKEVKGSFKSKEPVKVQLAVEKKLKALAGKSKKSKFEQYEYHPSLDVANGTLVSYEVAAEGDGMTVVTKMGSRGATLKADASGVVKHGAFAVGSREVKIDLMEEAGGL